MAESPEAIEDGPRDPEESTHTTEEVTTAEVIPTSSNASSSGRVPKAVMGTRLIVRSFYVYHVYALLALGLLASTLYSLLRHSCHVESCMLSWPCHGCD